MTTPRPSLHSIPPPDVDLLSAYLDDQLSTGDRAALEARLNAEPTLQDGLEQLRRTVAVLRAVPEVAIPRSFRLDPAKYRRSIPYWARYGTMRAVAMVGSAAATFMILFGLLMSRTGFAPQMISSTSPQNTQAAVQATQMPTLTRSDKGTGEGNTPTALPTATGASENELKLTMTAPAAGMIAAFPTPTSTPASSATSVRAFSGGDEGRSAATISAPAPILESAAASEEAPGAGAADALLITASPRAEKFLPSPSPQPLPTQAPARTAAPAQPPAVSPSERPASTTEALLVPATATALPTATPSQESDNMIRGALSESINPTGRLLVVAGLALGLISLVTLLIAWLRSRT